MRNFKSCGFLIKAKVSNYLSSEIFDGAVSTVFHIYELSFVFSFLFSKIIQSDFDDTVLYR